MLVLLDDGSLPCLPHERELRPLKLLSTPLPTWPRLLLRTDRRRKQEPTEQAPGAGYREKLRSNTGEIASAS